MNTPSSRCHPRYQESLRFLYDRIDYEKLVDGAARYPFRLRRIADLLNRLELSHFLAPDFLPELHPKLKPGPKLKPRIPIVHIAGTKGKGSTSMMVSAALTESGIRTGSYTSPHVHRLEERFSVDGIACEEEELVELVDLTRAAAEKMAQTPIGSPSFFELTTALALLHFHRRECEVVVLEVGLGGRLDSTNVCQSTVTAITSIGLDHQHVLGNTKEQIASEKAGIIKPDTPIISGVLESGPRDVIAKIADQKQAPLFQLGEDFSVEHAASEDWGSTIQFRGGDKFPSMESIQLSLEGAHQGRNAAVALAILNQLQQQTSLGTNPQAIRKAFAHLSGLGRIERFVLPHQTTVIVDAAHNQDSVAALCTSIQTRASKGPLTFVFGTSIDKDAATMLSQISQLAGSIVLTRFQGNPRYSPTESLHELLPESWQGHVTVEDSPIKACQIALDQTPPGGTVVVCGSFFLAAETRAFFLTQSASAD